MEREIHLKRLYFRAHHRGSKETDLVLGAFARARLASMNDAALREFEAFLEENDNDIWDWVSGKLLPEGGKYAELIAGLREGYALS